MLLHYKKDNLPEIKMLEGARYLCTSQTFSIYVL